MISLLIINFCGYLCVCVWVCVCVCVFVCLFVFIRDQECLVWCRSVGSCGSWKSAVLRRMRWIAGGGRADGRPVSLYGASLRASSPASSP